MKPLTEICESLATNLNLEPSSDRSSGYDVLFGSVEAKNALIRVQIFLKDERTPSHLSIAVTRRQGRLGAAGVSEYLIFEGEAGLTCALSNNYGAATANAADNPAQLNAMLEASVGRALNAALSESGRKPTSEPSGQNL